MCNLYSLTRSQDAIRQITRSMRDSTGNLPPLPAIFPDQMAPVVRQVNGEREMLMMRWGFPPPPKIGDRPVTNVRNVASPFWRAWLKPEYRCLVPFTSFCEWQDTKPRKTPIWFGKDESRPVLAFAGIWRPWQGERHGETGEHLLYSFLTCPPNAIVAPIHPKAMPVVLSSEEEWDVWLNAPTEVALELQRPAADDALQIVARGERRDG